MPLIWEYLLFSKYLYFREQWGLSLWLVFLTMKLIKSILKFKMLYIILNSRASLVAQLVKNLPVMQDTWVWSLGWEDPLEKRTATQSSILAWKIYSPWSHKESDMIERLSLSYCFKTFMQNYIWEHFTIVEDRSSVYILLLMRFEKCLFIHNIIDHALRDTLSVWKLKKIIFALKQVKASNIRNGNVHVYNHLQMVEMCTNFICIIILQKCPLMFS